MVVIVVIVVTVILLPRHRMRKAQCDEEEGGVVNVRLIDMKLADNSDIDDKNNVAQEQWKSSYGHQREDLSFCEYPIIMD